MNWVVELAKCLCLQWLRVMSEEEGIGLGLWPLPATVVPQSLPHVAKLCRETSVEEETIEWIEQFEMVASLCRWE